jgi:hypothetical protein
MRRKISAFFLLAAAVGTALISSACGGNSSGSTTTANVTAVAITPTTTTDVPINTSFDFTATVTLSDSSISTTTAVTWFVNGIAGGNQTVGTIVPLSTDNQVGVYTAPGIVPATNNGQVNITATAEQSATCTTNCTITSNTVVVQVTVVIGLTISRPPASIPAGGSFQFTAVENSLPDPSATWTVSSTSGGNIGTIDLTGLYMAPPFPPPGAVVTITATDSTLPQGPFTATATVTITYSNLSLKGPYAFSYAGNDASGFMAVAGSFNADGNGHITSGVEDSQSSLTGIATQLGFVPPVNSTFPGTYLVGPDGRAIATINTPRGTETWQFALTSNQHALMLRFNSNVTGSGTIDQQFVGDLANPNSLTPGSYVFSASGLDASHNPLAMAGMFSADGAGDIPNPAMPHTIVDITQLVPKVPSGFAKVDSQTVASGPSYMFDSMFPGTGRGTLSLTSGVATPAQFAFYSFAEGTRLHLIEIDGGAFLAGDAYAGPGAASLNLASANYALKAGGNSGSNNFTAASAYAAGGVFASNGSGTVTGGIFDSNNAGTVTLNTPVTSCPYTVDPNTGRIDLKLCLGGGSPTTLEYAVYQTSQGSALMIELDPTAISTGVAYQQSTTAALAAGNFAMNLAGQGLFFKSSASFQQNVEGQLTLSFVGNLDINIFGNLPFQDDPISATASSLVAPNATTGRGTAAPVSAAPFILNATNPDATYNLVYYMIDPNTALLFDQDKNFLLTGILARQF